MSQIDATVSGSESNSYLTIEDADVRIRAFPPAVKDAWNKVPDLEEWDWLLMRASQDVDGYAAWGPPKVEGQLLSFPREIDETGKIPERVLKAVMYIAEIYLDDDILPIKILQGENVSTANVLGASTNLGEENTGLPVRARRELDLLVETYGAEFIHPDEDNPLPGQDDDGTFY